jgi:hypothetical protein
MQAVSRVIQLRLTIPASEAMKNNFRMGMKDLQRIKREECQILA